MVEQDKRGFQMRRFTVRTLAATRRSWRKEAGEEAFLTECAPIFDWADPRTNYDAQKKGDSLAYGVFAPGSLSADALVEVVVSEVRAGRMTKLLKVFVAPSYWTGGQNNDQLARLFAAAIAGTIRLSSDTRSRIVKIYGRSEELLSLLYQVRNLLEQHAEELNIHCSMQGRWLEISTAT